METSAIYLNVTVVLPLFNKYKIYTSSPLSKILLKHKIFIMSLDSALSLYEQIKAEWGKPKQDLRKCGALLDQLKVRELIDLRKTLK